MSALLPGRYGRVALSAGILLVGVTALQASYSWPYYYLPDRLSGVMPAYSSNGARVILGSSAGIGSSDANGGSLILNWAQANTNIRTTLHLTTGSGTLVHYHRASSDALNGPTTSAGSYVAVELQNLVSNGASCTATLVGVQRSGGVITQLFSQAVGCHPGATFETFLTASNVLGVRLDDTLVFSTVLSGNPPASGSPGVGARNCVLDASYVFSTGFSLLQFGVVDATPPNDISASTLRWAPFKDRVELQWGGAADGVDGIGVEEYLISRGGVPVGATGSTSWVDHSVQPNTSYTYTIQARDGNMNVSPGYSFTLTTPALGTANPRRIGVRPTGAYWGAGGEQIDLESGNLNVSIPFVKPVGRGGMSAPVNLVYNSQLWRQDANGTWNLGGDVGFGYGWRLLVAAITPVYTDLWNIDHYTYTDSTGAEYRLDVKENGYWRSSQGVYVRYDDTKNWLILPDGNFLEMDVLSQGAEWDAGTRYPSRAIDTSANYIVFSYAQGRLAPVTNTSSRLVSIQDPRQASSTYPTYVFTYDTTSFPSHLISTTSQIIFRQVWSLQYGSSNLVPPFGSAGSFGSTSLLTSVTNTVSSEANTFGYDTSGSGELVQMITPSGGTIQWNYASFTNSEGMTQREVSSRSLTTTLNGTPWTVAFVPGTNDAALQIHALRQVVDSGAGALRNYHFQSDPTSAFAGLLTAEEDWDGAQTRQYRAISFVWAQDAWGHPYIAESDDTSDPGTSAAVTAKVSQSMASSKTGPYGQFVSRSQYSYSDLNTAARSYTYAYTAITGGLTPMWRLTSASITPAGGSQRTLFTSSYGAGYSSTSTTPVLHDSSLFGGQTNENNAPRGLRSTYTSTVGDLRSISTAYDVTGNATVSQYSDNSTVGYTADSSGGRYMLPGAVTPNGNSNLSTSFSWTSFLGLSQQVSPNGATTTIGYDGADRPSSTTSPDGAVTTYSYGNATAATPATVIAVTLSHSAMISPVEATGGTRWTITTLDGLGRTIQTDSGTSATPSTSSSIARVLTVYGPCACTPIGKVMQVSRPFNPSTGESPVWTSYAYDPLGRTTSVTLPDGVSQTTYVYAGNTVTVTDPGGRWKKYTSDVFGNVIQVNEPNPAGTGSPDYVTTYQYNQFNKLITVTMPRTMPGGNVITQTRTFNYDSAQRLTSVTHPESGTTTYTYDSAGRVLTRIDAKNNRVAYTYDSYGRIAQISRTPGSGTIEKSATTSFVYDASPSGNKTIDQSNLQGRLAQVTHGFGASEYYSYTASGRLETKAVKVDSDANPVIGHFGYDNEGRMLHFSLDGVYWSTSSSSTYFGGYSWSYDALGRQVRLSVEDGSTLWPLIRNATYNAAGQLTSYERPRDVAYHSDVPRISYTGNYEILQFQYNALGQLTQQSGEVYGASITYSYTTGAGTPNDGRLQSRTDFYGTFGPFPFSNATATTSYTYDVLGRLTSAVSSSTNSVLAVGQSFVYDPFGNLVQQNVTSGSAPALNINVDPNTNRINMSGFVYDAAGNLTQTPGGSTLAYDTENHMVMRAGDSNSPVNYYGAAGELLYEYSPSGSNRNMLYFTGPDGSRFSNVEYDSYRHKADTQFEELHFAGRLVWHSGTTTITDRIGSAVREQSATAGNLYLRSFSPYGSLLQGTPVDAFGPGYVAFATYRSASLGFLYAQNRYYDPARGRFTTPDPFKEAGGGIANPLSWNRYAYTRGDPVNRYDPSGLDDDIPENTSPSGELTMLRMAGGVGGVHLRAALVAEGEFGGDGGAANVILTAKAGFDSVRSKLSQAAGLQGIFSGEELDCIAGIETGRTWYPSIVAANGRVGLFQFNEANWLASGTSIPWNNGASAKNPETAAQVALALLYRKLGYGGVTNPTNDAVQKAIDNFGEGDGRYGKAAMDCAKQLKNGDFSGALSTLQSYANWVAGGRP